MEPDDKQDDDDEDNEEFVFDDDADDVRFFTETGMLVTTFLFPEASFLFSVHSKQITNMHIFVAIN